MTATSASQPRKSSTTHNRDCEPFHNWPEVGDDDGKPDASEQRITKDDMSDDPAEIRQWFPGKSTAELEKLLAEIQAPLFEQKGERWSVFRSYQMWDAEAQKQQRYYVRLVRWSGTFAVIAVVLAILQLPQDEWERQGIEHWAIMQFLMSIFQTKNVHEIFHYAEGISATLAFAAVGIGVVAAYSHHWQLRRLQAEQCRFLKFGYLLRCATSAEDAKKFLSEGLQKLHALDDPEAAQKVLTATCDPNVKLTARNVSKLWIRRDVELVDVHNVPTTKPAESITPQIVEYFVRKRIRYQAKYFKRQAHRRENSEKITKWLPVSMFFLSLFFAFLHFYGPLVYGLFVHAEPAADKHHEHTHGLFGLICLLCAAGLPAVGAWIRTYRGALEFARNANRFHGMWSQLHEFEGDLKREKKAGDLPAQLETLRDVEIAQEAEHRSWTRLMVEAEWYG